MEQGDCRKSGFPIKPTENKHKDNPYYSVGLQSFHLIYEKFGIPIDKAIELDVLTFNFLLRDAICIRYQETPNGQEYLDECWRFQQTEPDIEALTKYQQNGG